MNKDLLNQIQDYFKTDKFDIETIQDRHGRIVLRVKTKDNLVIVKYFENSDSAREIDNYKLLINLGVPTINIFYTSSNMIIMEDIAASKRFRMATEDDLNSAEVVKNLAIWLKDLHTKGKKADKSGLYSEKTLLLDLQNNVLVDNVPLQERLNDLIKDDNLSSQILLALPNITHKFDSVAITLTHNDGGVEQIVVGKNSALMLDYDRLGRGYPFIDISNALSFIPSSLHNEFLAAYGKTDWEDEKSFHSLFGSLVAIITAIEEHKENKAWAQSTLQYMKSDSFKSKLKSFQPASIKEKR